MIRRFNSDPCKYLYNCVLRNEKLLCTADNHSIQMCKQICAKLLARCSLLEMCRYVQSYQPVLQKCSNLMCDVDKPLIDFHHLDSQHVHISYPDIRLRYISMGSSTYIFSNLNVLCHNTSKHYWSVPPRNKVQIISSSCEKKCVSM